MRLDLLIASASAGLLVYSGRLVVSTARLRPEDIIAYKSLPGAVSYSVGLDPSGGGMVPYPRFPEDDTLLAIGNVLDSKIGFDLLVVGTIGGVLAIIAGAIRITWESLQSPSGWDYFWAAALFVLGVVAGWWWRTRSGWYGRQERRLLVHCFLAWLEREVGDPKTKGYDFGLTVVSTVRHSGFALMSEFEGTGPDEKAIEQWVVALARKHRYRWRREDFWKWASELSSWCPEA